MTLAYYVEFTLAFPEGVRFGAGKKSNSLTIARDGQGRPVLHGSSFAGFLRSLWRRHLHQTSDSGNVDDEVASLFGRALNDADGDSSVDALPRDIESAVKVTNYRLDLGTQTPTERTHHHRNRHRGTVIDGGLYSLEHCPPGTSAKAGFWVMEHPGANGARIEEFIGVVLSAFGSGVTMGGTGNRGIGRAKLDESTICVLRFDLSKLAEHAEYLAADRQWRFERTVRSKKRFRPINFASSDQSNHFRLQLTLRIPPGQDLLVGDGQADEVEIEPQKVQAADGKWYWRIPGASLRGVMRSWFHRLAVIDPIDPDAQATLADSADGYVDNQRETVERGPQAHTGENIGRGFTPTGQSPPAATQDHWPVQFFFGNLQQPGRIKISDGLAPCSSEPTDRSGECQKRIHVAVDRVTGGAAKGMLFDNRVLVGLADSDGSDGDQQQAAGPLLFDFSIQIDNPRQHEVRWLAQTLIALHLGLLRLGSSKSAGRLEFAKRPDASGACAKEFDGYVRNHVTDTGATD